LDAPESNQKYLESFEIWCWKRMEKISCTYHVKDKEVLHRVKEDRNFLLAVKKCKANCAGHILHSNCLLKHIIQGKSGIEPCPAIWYIPSITTIVLSSSFPLFSI
jgi:hypothetical protein